MRTRPPIVVENEVVITASAQRVWDLLADVERWPSWWRACRWVRVESRDRSGRAKSFRWRAHPVELHSRVTASDRGHLFAFDADGLGVHAERTFTLQALPDGRRIKVVSYETQVGWLAWLGRLILAPRLHAVNDACFADLARAAEVGAASEMAALAGGRGA